ncbi:MAG TPA: ion channel [Chthonomonadaceae bacterium]|nr:ion channel [Chthonomonadaceae bacterium]
MEKEQDNPQETTPQDRPQDAPSPPRKDAHAVKEQRYELLEHVQTLLARPMILLAFLWLALMVYNLIAAPLSRFLNTLWYLIWGLFVLQFVIEFTIAPHKLDYLKHHWLTLVSLILPAFRFLQAFRIIALITAHGAEGISLVSVLTSLNRGMRATRQGLGHRGIGYVVALTVLVIFVGGAGMYAFENPKALRQAGLGTVAQAGGGLHNYGDAIWFTGMILTTIGSDYFPQTAYGRILCFLLSVYGLSVFGYITASVASLFVGKDTGVEQNAQKAATDAKESPDLAALREEIAGLRTQITTLLARMET